MRRVLALDVGDKRIGIAVSDPLGLTAQGLETYTRTGDEAADAAYIRSLAAQYAPVRLLFGLPRNMDGSYGFQSERSKPLRAWCYRALKGSTPFTTNGLPPWRRNGPWGRLPWIGGPGARWWIRWLR